MSQDDLQTRDRILQTAFSLFLSKGYENTSVQAIIEAVGIAKGTFYHHFRGKEEMLVALVEGMSQRVVNVILPVVQDDRLGALEKMLAVSRAAVAQKAADFGPEVVLVIKQMRSRSNRLLADTIEEISQRWIMPLYSRVIAEGVAQGVFRVGHPELAAELVLGTIMGMAPRVTDLFIDALEGRSGAVDRLVAVYQAIEEAVERLLGAPEGSLPIYSVVNIRALLARFSPGGNA